MKELRDRDWNLILILVVDLPLENTYGDFLELTDFFFIS